MDTVGSLGVLHGSSGLRRAFVSMAKIPHGPVAMDASEKFYELVREGIVNALVHRNYDIAGAKCQLVVTPDTITIKSRGEPVPPFTLKQLQDFNAPMLSRNPVLHYVFVGIRGLRRAKSGNPDKSPDKVSGFECYRVRRWGIPTNNSPSWRNRIRRSFNRAPANGPHGVRSLRLKRIPFTGGSPIRSFQ